MIINSQQSDIEVLGNAKEFKTGIDPSNLEFITTLLSSNLYSNPEQSFIRETVSNAWDSHVEAGTTDIPVIIRIVKHDITIRDYGTGLSPERFNEIYRNIGSSTKRESNDYIGCFGIGHLSCFSCSNSCHIISYYNGTAYYYIGLKDGNSIVYNLVSETSTDEKNGLEVSIKNASNIYKYINALKYVRFFPNVYLDVKDSYLVKPSEFNSIKVRHYNNFAVSTSKVDSSVLLGNVLYPLSVDSLGNKYSRWQYENISNAGIVFKFNIGELEVTPNRENIIYSKACVDIINSRVEKAIEEINLTIAKGIQKDCNNLIEYYNSTRDFLYYNFIDKKVFKTLCYNEPLYSIDDKIVPALITYKGRSLYDNRYGAYSIIEASIPLSCIIVSNYKAVKYNTINFSKFFCSNTKILIANNIRCTKYVKEFLIKNYSNCVVIPDISLSDFMQFYCTTKEADRAKFVEDIYNYIRSIASYIDFKTDSNYKSFRKEIKFNPSIIESKEEKLNVHRWMGYSYTCIDFKSYDKLVYWIKGRKTGVIILGFKNHKDELFCKEAAKVKNFILLKVSRDLYNRLNSSNISCIVTIDKLLNDKRFIADHTFKKYNKVSYNINGYYGSIKNLVPPSHEEYFVALSDIKSFPSSISDRITKEDPYIKKCCEEVYKISKPYYESLDYVKRNYTSERIFALLKCIKDKTFRPKYSMYEEVITDKIIELCKA